MGTKLQRLVDTLATNWDYFRENGNRLPRFFIIIKDSTDIRMLENRHRESIKKTMLMHEDIFRQQVRELHRLYRAQRLLMDGQDNYRQKGTNICLDLNDSSFLRRHSMKAEYGNGDANPSSQECTTSFTTEQIRIRKRFDLQRSAEENMLTRVSANAEDQIGDIPNMPLMETNAEAAEDESDEGSNGTDVELSLSIGPCKVMRRSSSGSNKKESRSECSNNAGDKMGSSSTISEQENKKPHWLLHDLSLNGT